jgi:alanine racemase
MMNDLLTMQIDLHQLKENVDAIKEKSQRKIIVVVKSNAYRMGDIEVASFLEKHGVQYFGVVDMDEAVRLCEAGIKANILIFNSTQVEEFPLLEQYPNLIPSMNTIEDCRLLATHHFMPIKIHMQVDTGMSRIGFQTPQELVEGLWYIQNKSHITIEGIYSHITMPESLEKQEQRF